MDNDLFVLSAALLKKWKNVRMPSGATLSETLTIGKVSLWEVAAPFLALYRFPEFVLKTDFYRSSRKRVIEIVRPYRGMLGAARNDFFYATHRSSSDCFFSSKTSPHVLFINLWPLFYRETFRVVAEHLADNNAIATTVLFGDEKFPEKPSRSLIKFHVTYKHVTPEVIERTKKYQLYLRRIENDFLRGLRQVVYEDLPGAWPIVKREFRWLFWVHFPRLACEVAIAEHIIVEHCPNIVVSPDDSDRARIYTILARSAGIPSLIVQQGTVNEKTVEWRFCTANRIAAIGPSSVTALCTHGIASEKINLTGAPRFDILCQASFKKRNKIRALMGICSANKMVLLASQPYVYGAFSSPEARLEMLRAMGKTVASMESAHLVVKAHPTEDVRKLQGLIGNGERISFVKGSVDIQDLILECDVFVTFFSTSALQALIAAKPVISLCFHGSGVSGLYADSGAVFAARTEDELVEYLNILTGQKQSRAMVDREDARKKLVYDLTYLSDGFSAKRVAELITDMTRGLK